MDINLALLQVFLGAASYEDLKNRKISVKILGIFGVTGVIWQIGAGQMSYLEFGLGMIPGILLLAVGFISKEKIGYGDGLAAVTCGLLVGISQIAGLLMLAFFLSALWGIGLCLFRRANRNQEMPFLPFLLWAQTILLVLERGGIG